MLEELQKKINDSCYWDSRVKVLECNYFGDEVKLVFEGDKKDFTYYFEECYKVKIEHLISYDKVMPSKEFTIAQIPYFMQDVELKEVQIYQKEYMDFKINMYPIELSILCRKFRID